MFLMHVCIYVVCATEMHAWWCVVLPKRPVCHNIPKMQIFSNSSFNKPTKYY